MCSGQGNKAPGGICCDQAAELHLLTHVMIKIVKTSHNMEVDFLAHAGT